MPPAPNHQTSPRWGPTSGSATSTCPPHTKGSQFSERQSGPQCLSSTSSNTRSTLISHCYNASPRSMTSKHHGCCCCSFVPALAAPTCYECVHQTAPKTSPKLTTPPLGPASNPCCRPRTSQPHPGHNAPALHTRRPRPHVSNNSRSPRLLVVMGRHPPCPPGPLARAHPPNP